MLTFKNVQLLTLTNLDFVGFEEDLQTLANLEQTPKQSWKVWDTVNRGNTMLTIQG